MTKPLVSILTCAYNTEKYIAQTIESVLNQTEGNFEYILRNNGSTDRTGEICRRYAEKDNRITFLENKVNNCEDNGEPLLNIFPVIKGEYLAHLDSDDFLDPTFIEVLYKEAKESDADMVISGTKMFFDGTSQIIHTRIPPKMVISGDKGIDEEKFLELYKSLRPMWGKLYKTSFYNESKIYAFSYPMSMNSSDTYAVLGFFTKTSKSICLDSALHNYRIRKDSQYQKSIILVSRIVEGEILYQRGLEALKNYNIESSKTKTFLLKVYYSHLKDLIEKVYLSEEMNIGDKLLFYESLINDQFFNDYYLKNCDPKDIVTLLIDNVFMILNSVSDEEKLRLNRFFVVRFTKSVTNDRNKIYNFLSSVFDTNNKYNFGKEQIRLLNGFGMEDPSKVRERLNNEINESINIQKVEMLNALDKGDIELAMKYIDSILNYRILDTEAIYFKIYLLYTMQDISTAVEIAYMAQIFFQDEEDIIVLCNKILLELTEKSI